MHNGQYLCSVQYSGTVTSEDLTFSQFSLYFGGDLEVEGYNARTLNRQELEEEEVEVVSTGVQSTEKFQRFLRFVSITSKIK
jgi:hypothetical protein